MRYTPKIIFSASAARDAELFWDFLTHRYFLDKRRCILETFPKLKEYAHRKDFKEKVGAFVLDYYRRHRKEIQDIVESGNELIRRDEARAFQLLSRLVDYQWKRPITYRAYTTILPFSPFGKQHFYYSILRKLSHPEWKAASVLFIGIHEISHMIFFELLRQIEREYKLMLHEDAQYFLKEALTTALLNRRESMGVLRKEKKEPGNLEIQELRVISGNGAPQKIVAFVGKRYARYRNKKAAFLDFLSRMVFLTHTAEKDFNGKKKLWDKYGRKILTDRRLLAVYRKPIRLHAVERSD